MFEEKEVVNAVVGAVGLLVLAFIGRRGEASGTAMMKSAYFCVVGGYAFTIAEGMLWRDFFNLLEHASFGAAGLLYALGLWRLARPRRAPEGETP